MRSSKREKEKEKEAVAEESDKKEEKEKRRGKVVSGFFNKLAHLRGGNDGEEDLVVSGPTSKEGAGAGKDSKNAAPMPAADVVEKAFAKLAKQLAMPPSSTEHLSLANKWQLVQQYEATSQQKPEDFIQKRLLPLVKGTKDVLNDARLANDVCSQSQEWLERFIELGGIPYVIRVFSAVLEQSPKDAARAEGRKDAIVDCARVVNALMGVPAGMEVIARDPAGLRVLLSSIEYLNIMTQMTIVYSVGSLALESTQSYLSVMTALEHIVGGTTVLSKLIGLLVERENMDYRIALLKLIGSLLCEHSETLGVKKKLLTTLVKSSLPATLSDLLRNSEEEILTRQIQQLLNQYPDLILDEDQSGAAAGGARGGSASGGSRRAGDEASKAFNALHTALKTTDGTAYESFALLLQCLMLLPRGGELGSAVWSHVANFLQNASQTGLVNGDANLWFEGALKASLAAFGQSAAVSSPSAAPSASASVDGRLDKLSKEVDDLTYQLEAKTARVAELEKMIGGGGGTVVPPAIPPKPTLNKGAIPAAVPVAAPDSQPSDSPTETGAPPPPPPAPPVAPPGPPGDDGSSTGAPPPPPPPPSGGGGDFAGAPPPPPPPGGMAAMQPAKKKKPINPRTKMRGFAWKVLPPQNVGSTVFDNMEEKDVVESLPLDQLESLFAASAPAAKAEKSAAPAAEEAPQEVVLIESKRADNISIMLSKFKAVPLTQIRAAIVACDEEVLPLEMLQLVQPHLPSEEEAVILRNYDGDRARLSKADRFLLEMLSVPRIDARLSSMIFRLTFAERHAVARRTVDLCAAALKALRESSGLREILKVILGVGNYLNGGTFRGGAFGFKVSSLAELLAFKGNDGKTTLLDLVVIICRDKYPDLLNWHREVEIVCQIADVNLQQLGVDVGALATSMRVAETELANTVRADKDALPAKLSSFVQGCKPQLESLRAQATENEKAFVEVAKFFGEGPLVLAESASFFGAFDGFVRSFQGADRRLKLMSEKKAKQGVPAGMMAELAKRQSARQSGAAKQ